MSSDHQREAPTMMRICYGILTTCALWFVTFILVLLLALSSSSQRLYVPLVTGCAVFLTVWHWLGLLSWVSQRVLNRALAGAGIVVLLILVGHGIHEAYHGHFEQVEEVEPDLRRYRPFSRSTQLATLDQPSTLSLSAPLPRLDGATALYPVYAAFVQAVFPQADYDIHTSAVRCSRTGMAYERLIRRETDIIFVARPSQAHLAMASEQGVSFQLTPIGREAFVFFVNQDNPVTGLTAEQIRDIYDGTLTNWRDVGGNNRSIRAFQRPENSGSQTMLQHLMEGRQLIAAPTEDVVGGMGGIIARTASYRNYPNAIGYTFHFFATGMIANSDIRLLAIDGVDPSPDSIRDGSYPFTANFYAVTRGHHSANVQRLLGWIVSEQGQELVEKSGYTAIAP